MSPRDRQARGAAEVTASARNRPRRGHAPAHAACERALRRRTDDLRASWRSPRRPRSCRQRSPTRSLDRVPDQLVGQRWQFSLRHRDRASATPRQGHRCGRGFDFDPTVPLADLDDPPTLEAEASAERFRDDNATGRINGRSHVTIIPPAVTAALQGRCRRHRPSRVYAPSDVDRRARGPTRSLALVGTARTCR